MLRLWLCATCRPPDYPRYMTKNGWHSIDAQFRDGAGSSSLSLLPIEATNITFMTVCNLSPHRLSKIHDQESLTLHWHSFSWWGREHFTVSFAYRGNQYNVYDYMQPVTPQIIQDTWPRIIEALWMLILVMGQGAFNFLFCLSRQPILSLWLYATCCYTDCPRYMTKNRWRSVDAHFHDGAGSVSLFLLPIEAANTLFMVIDNLSPPRLSKIHDQELLTLRWCSFCHGCIHNIQSFNLA
jgi:hypothetical protein